MHLSRHNRQILISAIERKISQAIPGDSINKAALENKTAPDLMHKEDQNIEQGVHLMGTSKNAFFLPITQI